MYKIIIFYIRTRMEKKKIIAGGIPFPSSFITFFSSFLYYYHYP